MAEGEVLQWYYFIPRSGPEGRRWSEEYREAGGFELAAKLDAALGHLRRREIEPGRRLLAECEREVESKRGRVPPLTHRVLERWYLSNLAYYFYAVDDNEEAGRLLDQARDAIADAIAEAPFLVVLASVCTEFILHQARIARNLRRWTAMRDAIEMGRAMTWNRLPLCRLRDGREVFQRDLDDFFRAIPPADDEEREALAQWLDHPFRLRTLEHDIRKIELLPGVVIPFP